MNPETQLNNRQLGDLGVKKSLSHEQEIFLRRVKEKDITALAESVFYREQQLSLGKFSTDREKLNAEWEVGQLKAATANFERRQDKEKMLFRQNALTLESVPSRSLVENKDAVLNPMREIREYFKRQDPEYLEQLEALGGQIKEPMNKDTQAVVCIPVAGAQEASNIYKTLQSYAHQSKNLNSFEVLLLVNIPERFSQTKSKELEATLKEINRAKKDFPKLQVRNANVVLPDDQVRIGNIRKIGTDLALLRQQKAGVGRDLLLLSNDADNQGVSEHYVQSYLEYFKQHPEKEGAVGNLQFDPNAWVRLPVVHVKEEYTTYLDQRGFQNGNVNLFGSNSVMKSSIYSAIGGYPTALRTGEQEWTGKTIRKLRKQQGTLGFVEGALLTTSSRRGVISHLGETKEQLAFGNAQAEEQMRSLNIENFPMIDWTNELLRKKILEEINYNVNWAIKRYEAGDLLGKDSWYYRINLEKVGFKYRVIGNPKDVNSEIEITDMSKFIERQEAMQRAIKKGEKNMAKVYEASLGV